MIKLKEEIENGKKAEFQIREFLSHMRSGYLPLLVDLRALRVILEVEDSGALLATFHVRPLLVDQILAG